MLLSTKKMLNEYKTLILKMHQDVPIIQTIAQNLEFFCNFGSNVGIILFNAHD
jgi:hypothetical protein